MRTNSFTLRNNSVNLEDKVSSSRLSIGDKMLIQYDYCVECPTVYGRRRNWHRAEADVEIIEISSNVQKRPGENMVVIKTEDVRFIERTGTDTVSVMEEQLLQRCFRCKVGEAYAI